MSVVFPCLSETSIGTRKRVIPALWPKRHYAEHDRSFACTQNQPTSNSYEGTVAILLALLGLGGTGALQVLPHPYNDYVGWTLIWVAIIGAVALGVYHVSRTVEAPKYDPKPSKRIPMTAAEAGFLTALGATAISLIALGLRYRSTAAVLALIACVAVAFDFVDRQWFWESAPTERSLEADNSRIDVIRWQPILNDQKQLAVNIGLANNGKKTIREWTYDGSTATGAPGLLDRDLVDAIYIVLHRKVDLRVKIKNGINRRTERSIHHHPKCSALCPTRRQYFASL